MHSLLSEDLVAKLLGVLILAVFASSPAEADNKECNHIDCAITPYGYFEINQEFVERQGPYGTWKERIMKLELDGHVIKTLDAFTSIVAVYPSRENATLFLIYGGNHGNSCEMYRVLELKSKDQFIITDEFGNCRGIIADHNLKYYRVKERIVYEDGEWRFAHHSNKKDGNLYVPEWYSYRDGKIYEGKRLAGK